MTDRLCEPCRCGAYRPGFSGVPELDEMDGAGFYRPGSIQLPPHLKKIVGSLADEKRAHAGARSSAGSLFSTGAKPMKTPTNDNSREHPADGLDPNTRAMLGEPELLVEALAAPSYLFRLFVSGATPRSTAAIAGVRRTCEQHLSGKYELEVVDIYRQPEETRKAQIVAAPTPIKVLPFPAQRFVGDMSNSERILIGLDLKP